MALTWDGNLFFTIDVTTLEVRDEGEDKGEAGSGGEEKWRWR